MAKKSTNSQRINANRKALYLLFDRVTNLSFVLVAFVSIPLFIIIYLALQDKSPAFIKWVPLFFTLVIIGLALFRKKMGVKVKIRVFIVQFLLVGAFCLLLGLIDIAGLWFLMVVTFVILVLPKRQALFVLALTIIASTITGILLMHGGFSVPFNYDFYNCMTYCLLVRLLHYVVISIILFNFVSIISSHLNLTIFKLGIEMNKNKEIQQQMLDSVINTEEKERKRISTDLHDGLGPVLSAINLYFQAYVDAPDKQKSKIQVDLQKIIEEAIKDVSRISQNISPSLVENEGLITALKVFINRISGSSKIKFNLKLHEVNRFEPKNELTLYRAITELINNTIKHSKASNIDIEITIKGNNLRVSYHDNGIGFNIDRILLNNNGMGLKNIQSRIKSLGGYVIYKSKLSEGMHANIEIDYIENE